MKKIEMIKRKEVPVHGIPSSPKPICIGYHWDSGIVDLTTNFWVFVSLFLEDSGIIFPRFLQLTVSVIPKDKDLQEKIREGRVPSCEGHDYGLSMIYTLGLLRRNKSLGIIEFNKGVYTSSTEYSDQSVLSPLREFIDPELLSEDYILNQLSFLGDDPWFTRNMKLARKRLARINN